MGKGVLNAVKNVNTALADAVIGMDASDQRAVDEKMIAADGTPNKGNLGANAILGGKFFAGMYVFLNTKSNVCIVSLAVAKAGAGARKEPLWKHFADIAGNPYPETLPVPCFNVINGGEHAGNKLAFQEFFVIPTGATNFT